MMDKKTVLITGAGSGLAKEAVFILGKRGHKVIATTQFENQVREIKEQARKEKIELECFKLDILQEKDRELVKNYDFDVFIANAAIGESGSIAEVPIEKVKNVFQTNIFCNMELVQIVLKKMIEKNKKGRIIFLASLAGRIPMPFLSPYCASKAAIEIFATCLRQEMKLLEYANIEVGIIEPGAYATGFNKENNEKMYVWMNEESYFYNIINKIKYYQEKIWNFIEIKPYKSIIKKYIKAVEDRKVKHRYSAPWYQAMLVQLGRIMGM